MKPHLIKAALMGKKISQRDIARECHVSDSTVSKVIRYSDLDIVISRPVAAVICAKLGKPIEQVFPCYVKK
ncbi:MAG: hypothetical protein A4E74_02540 [Syntrophus sp. PtaB.Bin075]|nr:MAG: hypothetical protein A4E74_02540 [Syntrophus sp. PtaB.Bin075]